MLKKNFLALVLLLFGISCFAQGKFSLPKEKSNKIKFQLIDNLIIIPVEINGVKLSFLLDSGVSKPILFNIANIDTLQINNVETIYLRGLGGGEPVEALKSQNNIFRIGDAVNISQDIYVVFDNSINFTPRLGIAVHGIVGFDLFRDFTVEINYSSKYLKLHRPETYVYKDCKKCERFNLSFYNNKPYINGQVKINSEPVPVKLLVDTGSSDALWLFEEDSLGIKPLNDKYFMDFLGKGLSGSVYGKRSKVRTFGLKRFVLKNVNAAFPDSTSISYARRHEERNGSISGELLKRFNIIMDYKNARMVLKKNNNFNDEFHYDKSGITVEQGGVRVVKEKAVPNSFDSFGRNNDDNIIVDFSNIYHYKLKPAYKIVELRKGSPAEKAGVMIDDIILSVNNKGTQNLTLQEVNEYFRDDDGKLVRIKVERNGVELRFQFRLEDPLK